MTENLYPQCAKCTVRACENQGKKANSPPPLPEKLPPFCPMKLMPDVFQEAMTEYRRTEVGEFARQASIQEFQCYERLPDGYRTRLPRIEELIQFAGKCGYKRLGLAHCGGLGGEARLIAEILENNGYEVVSVRCKSGAVPKEKIGIRPEEKIAGAEAWETMCNPIAQAMIINLSGVDMAIMLGLCIGHDTLFLKYCRVPVTVLAVKDRVFGHNPLAAIYTSDTYYRRLKNRLD